MSKITDGELYEAMNEAVRCDLNIDYSCVDKIKELAEKEVLNTWNGAIYNYNGLDIQNLKHPFFEK